MKRRAFLGGVGASYAIGMLDWMRFFRRNGVPGTPKTLGIAEAVAQAAQPHFLIYWFLEGGWDGYSMFNPVATRNDALGGATAAPAAQIYRPSGVPLVGGLYPVGTSGQIRYGHLAESGTSLFKDMSILSSHRGGQFHSGSRLQYHMGMYNLPFSARRGPDERSVLQAFAEAYGAPYLLPHVSWHNWLSDGELAPANYPDGTGYYEKLGPPHAHTIYGGTPETMRQRIAQIAQSAGAGRDAQIHAFVDDLHANFVKDKNGQSVKAFAAAVAAHKALVTGGASLNAANLFKDPALNTAFGVLPADLLSTATAVNGQPARSKNSPNTNVQALMAYELMTKGASIGFWIESRQVRAFDTHRSRANVISAKGQWNQKAAMDQDLWTPLKALQGKLSSTQYGATGKSYWDFTTCVIASEMGRSMSGGDEDVCQHWNTSSVAFLGGTVKGGTQFGRVGSVSLDSIPLLPDGTLDPAYDPNTGVLKPGSSPTVGGSVPDAGHVYATALELAGIPKSAQKGKNTQPALAFVKK